MPRIIFSCRYLSGAQQHLHNLVSYIAKREGVEKIAKGTGILPVTRKQQALIGQVLTTLPDTAALFEYADYKENPNRGNASEFITAALERNMDLIGDRANLVDYMANRPRVERFGEHGLFSDTETSVVLSQVQDEVSNHKGNVWTNVVSLRREDAARLGYDNAAAWQALIRGQRNSIAQQMKIQPENFKWFAAFHDEGHHPHIHLIAYSANPKEGFLTEKGIENIRSLLARQIFAQDIQQIYTDQTLRRGELQAKAQSTLQTLISEMQVGVCDSPVIVEKLLHLAERLSNTAGKKQYGYLKADVKAIVDNIVDELAKDERVAGCYSAWQDLRNAVLQTYADKLPDPLPLSQQKELKPIKNMVIAEAVRLGTHQFVFEMDMIDELSLQESDQPIELPELVPPPDTVPDGMDDVDYIAEWSNSYKQARAYLFGTNDIEPDFDKATHYFEESAKLGNAHAQYALAKIYLKAGDDAKKITKAVAWLQKSANGDNPLAQYALGKLYRDGEHVDCDIAKAVEMFTKSAEQKNKYAAYALGKLYLMGKDVPCDKDLAVEWLTVSAEQGNIYAQFLLEHMDTYQNPSALFATTRLLKQLGDIFRDDGQNKIAKAQMQIDQKRMQQLREKKQAQGHSHKDHAPEFY